MKEKSENTVVKATDVTDFAINRTRCDNVIEQARELKALLSYNSPTMIENNKLRALSAIDIAISSLNELKAFIESEGQ